MEIVVLRCINVQFESWRWQYHLNNIKIWHVDNDIPFKFKWNDNLSNKWIGKFYFENDEDMLKFQQTFCDLNVIN